MHRLKILETFPIFLCKIRGGGGDPIWEYYTRGSVWKVISWVLSTDLNVRATLHVPKTADCGIVIISLVKQLYVNSDQTKRHSFGENRAVVPKRREVTQYRANTEAWFVSDDDCWRTCVNFRPHQKLNKRIRWKTVLKCPFSPPSLYLLFRFGFCFLRFLCVPTLCRWSNLGVFYSKFIVFSWGSIAENSTRR